MIKVSIIVPVYNVEDYLIKCLNSLVNQTLKDIEIIVINDGSLDNSQSIIDKFIVKYPNKIKAFTKENGGQGSARNMGLDNAKGKYVSFVDSDDWLDLNAIESMYKKIEEEKSDIIICDMMDHLPNGNTIYYDCTNYKFKYEKTGSSCNKMFKRELINDLRFIEKIWYEDLNFTTKLLFRTEKISLIHKSFYHCNAREVSTMTNNNSLKNLDIIICLDDLKKYFNLHSTCDREEIYSYLVFKDILLAAINRVTNHKNNSNKKNVLKILQKYCNNNIRNYKNFKFYKTIPKSKKIVAKLNYMGLYNVSNKIFKIKKIIRGQYGKNRKK